MGKYFLSVLIMLVVISCRYQVDHSSPTKIAEALNEGLVRNDNNILKQIFANDMERLSSNTQNSLRDALVFFKENPNLKLIKVEPTNERSDHTITLYYDKDYEYFRITSDYVVSENKIFATNFDFTNLSQKCEEAVNIPYKPDGAVDFIKLDYFINENGNGFTHGTVTVQNNSKMDIAFIQFRLTIKRFDINSASLKAFFSQTVDLFTSIPQGDIVQIEIPGMKDFYAGFNIDYYKLYIETELMDLRPKPLSVWCQEVEKLQGDNVYL